MKKLTEEEARMAWEIEEQEAEQRAERGYEAYMDAGVSYSPEEEYTDRMYEELVCEPTKEQIEIDEFITGLDW